MVFKGRFFSSKKSDSSSPDGSNSPKTPSSDSPSRSEKKKVKSAKEEQQIGRSGGSFSAGCRQTLVKDGGKQQQQQQQQQKKKEIKGKEVQTTSKKTPAAVPSSAPNSASKLGKVPDVKEGPSSISPILASSLGLNRIKTRSGPLPLESFLGFRGDKSSNLGSSNLSRAAADRSSSLASLSASGGKNTGKKKEVLNLNKMVSHDNGTCNRWDNGSNSDSMSTESAQSRDQSPNVKGRSRLQNGDSTDMGMDLSWQRLTLMLFNFILFILFIFCFRNVYYCKIVAYTT